MYFSVVRCAEGEWGGGGMGEGQPFRAYVIAWTKVLAVGAGACVCASVAPWFLAGSTLKGVACVFSGCAFDVDWCISVPLCSSGRMVVPPRSTQKGALDRSRTHIPDGHVVSPMLDSRCPSSIRAF